MKWMLYKNHLPTGKWVVVLFTEWSVWYTVSGKAFGVRDEIYHVPGENGGIQSSWWIWSGTALKMQITGSLCVKLTSLRFCFWWVCTSSHLCLRTRRQVSHRKCQVDARRGNDNLSCSASDPSTAGDRGGWWPQKEASGERGWLKKSLVPFDKSALSPNCHSLLDKPVMMQLAGAAYSHWVRAVDPLRQGHAPGRPERGNLIWWWCPLIFFLPWVKFLDSPAFCIQSLSRSGLSGKWANATWHWNLASRDGKMTSWARTPSQDWDLLSTLRAHTHTVPWPHCVPASAGSFALEKRQRHDVHTFPYKNWSSCLSAAYDLKQCSYCKCN